MAALVGKGDVEATIDPADSRRSLLRLSPAGDTLHDRVLGASLDRERLLLQGLSTEERNALFIPLAHLSPNMEMFEALG